MASSAAVSGNQASLDRSRQPSGVGLGLPSLARPSGRRQRAAAASSKSEIEPADAEEKTDRQVLPLCDTVSYQQQGRLSSDRVSLLLAHLFCVTTTASAMP